MASSIDAQTTDNELLMRFIRHRDENAFRRLVDRHATLVMGVCRQVSRNEHDAEDAFQATFLIVAGRAKRLMTIHCLAAWLHRVAYRVALRAAQNRNKRREGELTEEPCVSQVDELQGIHVSELRQILHQELERLPTRYREAIVLCDLLGSSRTEAADKLACTEASLKASLARGRRQLRMRLLRRGVVFTWALTTAHRALAETNVSPHLLEHAVEGSMAVAQGSTASGSTAAEALARKGDTILSYSSISVLVAVGLCVAGLGAAPLLLVAQGTDDLNESKETDVHEVVIESIGSETAQAANASVSERGDFGFSSVGGDGEEQGGDKQGGDKQGDAEAQPDQPKVEDLVAQLRETLEQRVKLMTTAFQEGDVSFSEVVVARIALLEADLEAAETPAERVEVYKSQLTEFASLEKYTEQMFNSGLVNTSEILSARASRLKVQIALEKEKRSLQQATADEVESGTHAAKPGDVLGVYIENVIGGDPQNSQAPILIASPRRHGLPPAYGHPVVIDSDGTIRLPFAPPIKVAGLEVGAIQQLILKTYTKELAILRQSGARVLVTLAEIGSANRARLINDYRIKPGDTLGIVVPGVLGDQSQYGPIHYPDDVDLPPSVGFPVVVQSDGLVHLPLVDPVKLEGLKIGQAQDQLLRVYTKDNKILRAGGFIIVTIMKRARR